MVTMISRLNTAERKNYARGRDKLCSFLAVKAVMMEMWRWFRHLKLIIWWRNLSRFVLRAPAAWTNVKRSQNASIRKEHFGHTLKHGSDFTKHDLLLVFMILLQEVNVHILFKISKTEFDFLTLYITLAAIKKQLQYLNGPQFLRFHTTGFVCICMN